MKVDGKTIVVTGGGSGMGREMVLLLLKKGARVAAVDINETTLADTAELTSNDRSRLTTHAVNIAERDAVLELVDVVIEAHGAVDGVINNAGIIQRFVRVHELEFMDIERVMNVNFWGLVHVTKAFLPHLMARPEAHIVNISSMGAFLPVPGQTVYGASKAAVTLFSDGLHSELLDTHVRVSTVFPGATETNISVNSDIGAKFAEMSENRHKMRMTTAAAAAEMIIAGMEKNRYHIMVGTDARMMNLFRRIAPERAARFIFSQMHSLLPE
jgi:short-subunit dehydrogenase